MKVQIVSYEDPDKWILGKFARKMSEHLCDLEVDAILGREPNSDTDVNHHICYVNYDGFSAGINTLMVTHVDSFGGLRLLKNQLESADLAVCMSSHTMRNLRGSGLPWNKICYVNPAHDGVLTPRRLRVGIMTRLYEDGRKNEGAFAAMLDHLPNEDLHFIIMGDGWQTVVNRMRGLGISVEHYPSFDLERYWELMPGLDYYVYFGHDEGSMGFIDAIAAGVATIVTPQGYHLDVENGIDHSIENLNDLAETLTTIVEDRRLRVANVAEWSWRRYAEKHLELWMYLTGYAPKRGSPADKITARPSQDGVASLQLAQRIGLKYRAEYLFKLMRTSIQRRLRTLTRDRSN